VLLGTGPLVDPGFYGRLLIPLHNLTSANYDIDTNEALIWIEFTKTTFGFVPKEELAAQSRGLIGFPPDKRWLTPEQYLRKANGPNPIRSSIPSAILQAKEAAHEAKTSADASLEALRKMRSDIWSYSLIGLAALAIALYQIGQQFGSMVQNAQGLIAAVQQGAISDTKAVTDKANQSQDRIDKLTARVDELNSQLDVLRSQVPPPKGSSKR
jgi:hypothetical protein